MFRSIESLLAKQIAANEVKLVDAPVANSINVVVGTHKFYLQSEQAFDSAAQKEKLEKELAYQKGFLEAAEKKLANERFVQNAKPEVVEAERRKRQDAKEKIKAIEESLASL